MAKAVREAFGKKLLAQYLQGLRSDESALDKDVSFPVKTATVTAKTDYAVLAKENPWLETEVRFAMRQLAAC